MKFIFFIFIICSKWDALCQKKWEDVLNRCEQYYDIYKIGSIEIFTANKNFLKNDTNFYNQDFLFDNRSEKVGKLFYHDKTGFSIYKNSTTYYVYTYDNTYYVGENSSDNHLKFLPHWAPHTFFKKYFAAAKLNDPRMEYDEDEKCYILYFHNDKDWNSILYIKEDNYSLIRYNETYIHKKFGTQFKDYRIEEKPTIETSDQMLKELDSITTSYIQTTDENIKEKNSEYERTKKGLIQSKINKHELLSIFSLRQSDKFYKQYILLDYYYQTCFPCLKAIPELNKLRVEFDDSILLIIGVDPVAADAGHKEKFKQRYNVTYPVYDGNDAIKIKKISLPGLTVRYPTIVLIKPDGTIEYIMEQYSKDHFKVLRSYFKNNLIENR